VVSSGAIVGDSKQVEEVDKFTILLRLLAIPIGFPLGQLPVLDASVGGLGLVGGP
jgi:hypothetical protein